MRSRLRHIAFMLIGTVCSGTPVLRGQAGKAIWSFAVSGDSRNCGDVVMPGIAASVAKAHAAFYWHLGDFRAIYNFDEDIQHQPEVLAKPLTIDGYEDLAWRDFIDSQLSPFGQMPIYLAIGNHEIVSPKTREQFLIQFADWLETPLLHEQRLTDNPHDFKLRTYYHWIVSGVDFITLDNATNDQFDRAQIAWFEKTLAVDASNPAVRTVIVGMHKALPSGISDHSMDESPVGIESGHRVYADLLKIQNEARKRVYVLASHSHYFSDNVYDTDYWRNHGGVLPGWIVGTAGAQRYKLPPNAPPTAKEKVYGFLLGTADGDGDVLFTFQPLNESDVPAAVVSRYTPAFVNWCFENNALN
jgi:hypothetical protein